MPKLITERRLLEAVKEQTFIKHGSDKSVEGVKYDFRMGTQVLKSSYSQPVDTKDLSATERASLFIEPGEVVFVRSEEQLALTDRMIALLSPKRKLSHEGIIVLGGFCIDPLYDGPLYVGLYNFSSSRFRLMPGRKLIAALFLELDDDEGCAFPKPESAGEEFPDDLLRLIAAYKPIALPGLREDLSETQRQLADLRNEITSGREWQRQFQSSLEAHDRQIDKLLNGLGEETVNRKEAERAFRDQVSQIQREMWKMTARLSAIIGGVVILLSAIAQAYLPALVSLLRGGK